MKAEYNQLLRKVKNALTRHELCRPGQHLLLAVSGGADSVALLHLMCALAPTLRLRLSVAHLHHGLRGKDADADAAFVRSIARQRRLAFVTARVNVRARARRHGVSLEMAGRAARYDFLAASARRLNCEAVAVAHTADDHIETVLLKMARGTGPRGLCGISRVSAHNGARIVRPLRDIWRRELIKWLRYHNFDWREDLTNTDEEFLRNRVRHTVLPLLRAKLNPNLEQALWRLADIMEQEEQWLESLILPIYQQCRVAGHIPMLNCELLQTYPLAARRRVLRHWLTELGIAAEALDFQVIERLERLLAPNRSGRIAQIASGYAVRREHAHLKLLASATPQNDLSAAGVFEYKLAVPGSLTVAELGWRITCEVKAQPANLDAGAYCAYMSLQRCRSAKIIARSWRPGDRIAPFGMTGSRKLQDVFSDLKIPVSQRRCLPVLEARGEIIWVPGYRLARGWEVPPNARRVICIRLLPM